MSDEIKRLREDLDRADLLNGELIALIQELCGAWHQGLIEATGLGYVKLPASPTVERVRKLLEPLSMFRQEWVG